MDITPVRAADIHDQHLAEPRLVRHAVPYVALSSACVCPTAHPCGGIVPNSRCPEHGDRRTPTMEWHWEEHCSTVTAP
ncbi:hypothetical protein [Streptomyces cucumeris]|uniref:hypothetical protein n=1 Tax=Streptomyces cucumeris TaxID=2962890 RepID=UPI003D732BE9